MNHRLEDKAKCMLVDAKLYKSYWADAINVAAYVANHSASSVLEGKTVAKLFFVGYSENKGLSVY